MTANELSAIFDSFSGKKILVIGDVMVDSYIWGDVNRISPEAPVPILSCNNTEDRLGGAANVVLNINAMGATPVTCAIIGNDETGEIFRQRLAYNGLSDEGLFVCEDRPTTRKTRMIANQQQLLRVDEESIKPIADKQENEFIAHTLRLLGNHKIDAIIFEDYDKGVITPKLIEAVVGVARRDNIPTLVDPKKRNFLNYKGVNLFKPNFKELKEGLGREIARGDFGAIHAAAQEMLSLYEQDYVLTTLSELGVFIADKKNYFVMPAQVRDIADVSGAGDTVISIASLCLAAKMPPKYIASISNIGGGLVCEKVGVVPINKKQLLAESIRLLCQQG